MKVLIVRLDSVGDVLLAGPSVAAAAVEASVHLLVSSIGAPAAHLLPGADRVITFDAPWILDPAPAVDGARLDELVAVLADERYDAAAILTSSHQSCLPMAMLLRLAGVRRIAAVSHEYAGRLLDHRIPGDPDLHEVERNLAVLNEFGLAPIEERPRLAITADVPAARPGRVVVHPGAAAPARTLPAERWAEIAGLLAVRGHDVVVTGTASEAALCSNVAAATGWPPVIIDLDGLAELAAELGRAEVVVVGNTGPAHLAAAVGRPVVSVFPPTVPFSRWRPWAVRCELVADHDVDCAGCRSRRCPFPVQACLEPVTAERVADAVARLGGRPAATHPRSVGAPSLLTAGR